MYRATPLSRLENQQHMLAEIIWEADPIIFELGPLAPRWYGLMWASSFLFGYLIMARIYKWEGVDIEELDKLSMNIIIGAIAGARLGHVLFYEPLDYLSDPLSILKVWEGGMASHGGAIGILIAVWLSARKFSSRSFMWILDRLVVTVALAGFFIRFGNLMNHEIIGEPASVPWAFVFTRVDLVPRHPTQLYEALSYLIIFFILGAIYLKKREQTPRGFIFGLFLALLFAVRFFVEFYKEEQVAFEEGMLLNMGQLLSIPFVLIGLFIFIRSLRDPSVSGAKP